MTELAVIILAAGKGTRMKSDLPKVLHKVAGKSMLSHVISAARELKPAKIIVVVSPGNEAVADEAKGCKIAIQYEQLGTADAAKAGAEALKDFPGNVLILYGDCPLVTSSSLTELLEKPLQNEIRIFGFEASKPAKYGRLVTSQNTVREVVEFRDASPLQKKITLCNSGIYYLPGKLLGELVDQVKNTNAQNEYYLTDIIKIGWRQNAQTTYLLIDEDEISGVNDKVELARVEHAMQKHLLEKAMLDGVTILAPETTFLSADTKFGRNVTIRQNVVIDENVVIGNNVTIGPFAHLRPGTLLRNGASIGNFVEIKKSDIGENSKINHLSYIGDSTLGSNVNIGAGTITCNYDGVAKYDTTIGDDAFIGSNTALIAPVLVGKGAIVAAGSVIVEEVPAGALGIARPVQKNLADWVDQFRKKKQK